MADFTSPLVWIDLEMTGLDSDRCHIIEVATLITTGTLELVAEGPNLVIRLNDEELSTLSDWSRDHFTRSGLIERSRNSPVSLAEAEAHTLKFVSAHCSKGTSPLCGNSVHNDRAFLARRMPALHDWLHYRNVDVSSIKEVGRRWFGNGCAPPKKSDKHEALEDIRESVAELRWYRDHLFVQQPR
ncbi:MAG: oligoribonuclease [Planctomycetes bacterium]|nr:oligoribonuclease [Planctomycetota bacterium]